MRAASAFALATLGVAALGAGCGRFGFGGHLGAAPADSADGPPGDGGGSGDGGGGDAAQVCPMGLDLCDGFEAGVDTSIWTLDSMVTLDTTKAHRGTTSIHVHLPAFAANTGSYQTMQETKTIVSSTTFWVRAWFWLSALPATGNGLELITAETPGSNGDYLFTFSDSTHIYTQYGNASQIAMTPVPTGQWVCAIWKVARATTTSGSMELSGDLPPLTMTGVKTDSATAPMTVLTIGMGFASSNTPSAQSALDLWIDDVIVHSAAVTCAE